MNEQKQIKHDEVVNANRQFYDAVAFDYERIDGRRGRKLESWLLKTLVEIRKKTHGSVLLDLGSGSGFVTRCSSGLFRLRVALDISPKILTINRHSFDHGIVADINHLPFASQSLDVVSCFSVLHHLYDVMPLVSEVSRILKPGGIFYSDHDMDKKFSERFHILLWLYRKLCNSKSKYFRASNIITYELYNLTEWREDGIDSRYIADLFKKEGFSVNYHFHWFGLNSFADILFGERQYSYGYAPLFSILAIKK